MGHYLIYVVLGAVAFKVFLPCWPVFCGGWGWINESDKSKGYSGTLTPIPVQLSLPKRKREITLYTLVSTVVSFPSLHSSRSFASLVEKINCIDYTGYYDSIYGK